MTTYRDAYHQARQYKAGGVTPAELRGMAARLDDEGLHGPAEAFRAVADE